MVIRFISKYLHTYGLEFVWVVMAQVFSLIGGMVVIKILANSLTGTEFGLFSLLYTFPSLLMAILYQPLGEMNMRFLSALSGKEDGGCYFPYKKYLLILSLICLALVFPVSILFSGFLNEKFGGSFILMILAICMGCQTAQQFVLMGLRLRTIASYVQIFGSIVRPLMVVISIHVLGKSSLSAIVGLALGFFLMSLVQYAAIEKYWNFAEINKINDNNNIHKADQLGKYFGYGFYQSIVGLLSVIVICSDRWILSTFGTLDQVAIYAALMQIASAPTSFLYAIVSRFVSPIYFATTGTDDHVLKRRRHKVYILWLVLSFLILMVTFIFSNHLVMYITNEEYAEFSYLLPWIVLGLLIQRSSQIAGLNASYSLKTNTYLFVYPLLIIAYPMFEYFFLVIIGYDGIAIGLMLAALFSLMTISLINKYYL